MDKAGRQKTLKVLSVFETVMGFISLCFGLFMSHGGTNMLDKPIRSLNATADSSSVLIAIGFTLLFEGIFALTGSSFIRSAGKNAKHYKPALYFALITFIFNCINLVFALLAHVKSADIVMTVIFMALNAIIVMMIDNLRKQAL